MNLQFQHEDFTLFLIDTFSYIVAVSFFGGGNRITVKTTDLSQLRKRKRFLLR
jgi:hypothetical protein